MQANYFARTETTVTGPISPDSGNGGGAPNARGPGASTRLSSGSRRSPACRFVHSLVTFTSIRFAPGLKPRSHPPCTEASKAAQHPCHSPRPRQGP